MKVNAKQLKHMFNNLSYTFSMDGVEEVDIVIKEDDPGNGTICACLVLSFSKEKEPNQYEKGVARKHVETSVELFSSSENRPIRFSIKETKELT